MPPKRQVVTVEHRRQLTASCLVAKKDHLHEKAESGDRIEMRCLSYLVGGWCNRHRPNGKLIDGKMDAGLQSVAC
jgi:hypothetical protein